MLRFILKRAPNRIRTEYFNTSHVTVYQWKCSNIILQMFHFNTSHVTVYPGCTESSGCNRIISIHLMLRFIMDEKTENGNKINFNTSHVTVYLPMIGAGRYCIQISIHLMLRFILTSSSTSVPS